MPAELEFDSFSENPFEANKSARQTGANNHIWSIKKTIRKPNQYRRKDYDKNICRYIVRKVIRCLASPEYKSQVELYCRSFNSNYNQVKKYYEGQIERILGLRALRDEWVISEDDDDVRANQKRVFRSFSEWFLKHRYIRYVLNGKGSRK